MYLKTHSTCEYISSKCDLLTKWLPFENFDAMFHVPLPGQKLQNI